MRSLTNKKANNKIWIAYTIVFVLLFFLCFLFPYSGDDWAWGSSIGLERLDNWFYNYSGRYFGNLIVIALTRSNLLKAVVMSFCLTGIIVLLNKLTGEQKNGVFLISTALVFMPVSLLSQSIVWTSGFANYTTSVFLTLIYIYYVRNMYGDGKPKNSFISAVFLLILGFGNALIVEHMTVYNVVLGIYVIIFIAVKFKKVCIENIAYSLGTIAGAFLMLSNPVYRSVASGEDGYRTIADKDEIIIRVIRSFFGTIAREGFFKNVVLNVLLVSACLVIWYMVKNKITKKARFFGSISVVVMIAYVAGSAIVGLSNVSVLLLLIAAEGVATIAYILAFIVFLFILPFEINQKIKLFFILLSVGCMIAPLLVVTPITSRCFFAPYVMMIYLGMEFYSLFDEKIKAKSEKITKATAITAVVGLIYLFYIYGTIGACSYERAQKAIEDSQSGTGTIQVEELPYKEYVWLSDVDSDLWAERFKLFYGIDDNVKIEQIESRQMY